MKGRGLAPCSSFAPYYLTSPGPPHTHPTPQSQCIALTDCNGDGSANDQCVWLPDNNDPTTVVSAATHATTPNAASTTTVTMAAPVTLKQGQVVSGPGIAEGTKVAADVSASATFTIDTATAEAIPASSSLSFTTNTATSAAATKVQGGEGGERER